MPRVFTQAEVELARARMPTEAKPLTGFFKWKDIKRWHKTWHVYLCKWTENMASIHSADGSKVPVAFAFMAQFGQSGGSSMISMVFTFTTFHN